MSDDNQDPAKPPPQSSGALTVGIPGCAPSLRGTPTAEAPFLWQSKRAMEAIARDCPHPSIAKVVYMALTWLASDHGSNIFTASKGQIAAKASLSTRAVCRALYALERHGLIAVQRTKESATRHATNGYGLRSFSRATLVTHVHEGSDPGSHDVGTSVMGGSEPDARYINKPTKIKKEEHILASQNGGTDNGKPVLTFEPSPSGNGRSYGKPPSAYALVQQRDALDQRIAEVKSNGLEDAFGLRLTPAEQVTMRELKARRAAVVDQLSRIH